MDPRLLQAYNDELVYLREAAREFGEEHQTVAGRLGLQSPAEVDPHVERLLEGVAFLGARVQLKLRDQFPDFTQHLLHALQPNYLAPTPSMCVVAFEPRENDGALADGIDIPRLSHLNALAGERDGATVTFRTGHDVTLWPLQLTQAEYLPSRASLAPFLGKNAGGKDAGGRDAGGRGAGEGAEAGLRIRLTATGGAKLSELAPGPLPLYLDGSQAIPGELYRQLVADAVSVVLRPADSVGAPSADLPLPRAHGFEEECALIPSDGRTHRGYRLLSEYFACPERFLFIALDGLACRFAACGEATECDVVILFRRRATALVGSVTAANLRLYATPAVNLFEKQLDRVAVTAFDHERLTIADRTRPLDFEVNRLLDVRAHRRDGGTLPVVPMNDFAGLSYDWSDALFYATRLTPRRLPARERRANGRSDYVGTETWISVSAPARASRTEDIHELSIRALVTNRDLPERMGRGRGTAFSIDGVAVSGITMLRPPTPPRAPLGLNDGAWRVIAHLTPNQFGFAGRGTDECDAGALRHHLALYARPEDAVARRQVEAVKTVRAEPVSRRAPGAGPSAFVRGQRLHLGLDEAGFDNGRMVLFGAVIDRFLAEFASINSFTETALETTGREGVTQWPARLGRRPTI